MPGASSLTGVFLPWRLTLRGAVRLASGDPTSAKTPMGPIPGVELAPVQLDKVQGKRERLAELAAAVTGVDKRLTLERISHRGQFTQETAPSRYPSKPGSFSAWRLSTQCSRLALVPG